MEVRAKGGLYIQDLPNEILDHVFSFLSVKERIRTEWVCRSWAEFGKNYKWSWPVTIDDGMIVSRFQTITDDIRLSVLSRCGTNLKRLEMILKFLESYTSTKLFDIIGSNCPNLTEIVLYLHDKPREGANKKDSLVLVTRGCPKLDKISIRQVDCYENADFFKVCLALKECKSLEYLELDSVKVVAEECLDTVQVPLKRLDLWAAFDTNFAPIAQKLLKRNDPIEELGFQGQEEESQSWLAKVVRHYKKTLKVLSLHYCEMSSSKLCKIPITLEHLEVLSLKSAWLVDDEVMKVLAANCKKLWALNISKTKVSDAGISAVAALPNLTCVDVSRTSNITGEGLRKLASHGRLEMFYFACIVDLEEPNAIEESCIELVNCSPNLHLLDLRFNYGVSKTLVDKLRSAVQRGAVKGPVVLHLSIEQMGVEIDGCDGLELAFDPRRGARGCGRGANFDILGTYDCVVPPVSVVAGRITPWGREVLNGWGL